jgi:hypothetical protein
MCNGVKDEKEHLPCLKHGLECADDFCAICYVEALKDAPCIQLLGDCQHVFHAHCVQEKVKSRWPGARISFDFLKCPVCSQEMDHPALAGVMAPVKELRALVEKKATERLEFEGRAKDPAIVKPSGAYFNNPVGFAMHQYLFYMCFKCQRPYFAGGYQCQEANAPFDPKELMCPSCQPQGAFTECPVHGKDWLAFKCRFCTNYANWYCWGNTHFCDQCHKSGVWQKLVEFRTGKCRKKVWEYEQCASLKPQIEAIAKDGRLSEEQKVAKLETLRCDPVSCFLGVAHPPSGFEFGLGCSMCEDKQVEAKNKAAAAKAKEDEERMRQALEHVKNVLKQHPGGLDFVHREDFDENGLFYYLGTLGKTRPWANPADGGFVRVNSSGMMNDSAPLAAIVGREVVRCVTKPVRNAWIMLDLMEMALEPAAYTLRHYSSWDTECLRHWVLEASNDGVTWDALRVHRGDEGLKKAGSSFTWPLESNGKRYRMFRIVQTNLNSNNHFYLACSGWEMYGRLFEAAPLEDEKQQAGGAGGGGGRRRHREELPVPQRL